MDEGPVAHVEDAVVPRAGHGEAVELALVQRPAAMRAVVRQCVELAAGSVVLATGLAVLELRLNAELGDGQMRCVAIDGTAVMVARAGGDLYALSDHCSHRGGPLHEGELRDGTIRCPWHDSVFALEDGALIHGPSAYPQPAWDARVREGRIEVRRSG